MTADPTMGTASTPQAMVPLSATSDGDWISVTRLPHGVARVRTRHAEQGLVVRATGGGEPRPGDWGEVEADGVFALRAGTGYAFTATFDGPDTSSRLQTNLVHGVMAVHGFHRFIDGSGRRDYFTREFYVPAGGGEAGEPETAADGGLPSALLTGVNDPSGLVGVWTVLDRANMNISALDCAAAGGGRLTVRAYGPETDRAADWGTVQTHLYADAARPDGPPTFLATFDLPDRRVDLQVRNYNGILVGAQYTTFTDGNGRPDYFTRDCFRR
jgi:hypothetical protein